MRFIKPTILSKISIHKNYFAQEWYRFFESFYQYLGFDELPVFTEKYQYASQMFNKDSVTITNSLGVLPDGSTSEFYGGFKLPNNYKPNTDIYLFVDLSPSDTSTNDVVLVHDYGTGDYTSALAWVGDANTTVAMGGTADLPQRTDLVTISGAGLVKNGLISVKVGRVGADGDDDYTASINLIGVGIKYQVEGIGWDTLHP